MMPQQGETRSANGETRQWDGGGWVLLGGTASPGGNTSEPWNAGDTSTATSALKAFLGLGGATVGSVLGPAGTIAGGAVGRMVGHIPEALVSRTTGKPNDSSFLDDAVTGGEEGAAAELAPAALGMGAKFGGRVIRVVGDALGRVTGGDRLGLPVRAMLAHTFGGSPIIDAAAAAAPPAMSGGGRLMENAGEAMGTKRLSQHMSSLLGRDQEPAAMDIAEAIKNSDVTPRAKWNDAEEVPYRAGSGRSDAFSEQTPKLNVKTDSWPSNESVFGDVRPELADVDMAKAALAKGWSPANVRRVIMESPSLQSLRNGR